MQPWLERVRDRRVTVRVRVRVRSKLYGKYKNHSSSKVPTPHAARRTPQPHAARRSLVTPIYPCGHILSENKVTRLILTFISDSAS